MKKFFLTTIVICSILLISISITAIIDSKSEELISSIPVSISLAAFLICSTIGYYNEAKKK